LLRTVTRRLEPLWMKGLPLVGVKEEGGNKRKMAFFHLRQPRIKDEVEEKKKKGLWGGNKWGTKEN